MKIIEEIYNSKESQKTFIKGLINVIKADGVIDESEKTFLSDFLNNFDFDNKDKEEINNFLNSNNNEVTISFENDTQKLFFLKEALQLCYIDGEYHDEEKRLIMDIGKKLGINVEKIKNVEKWTAEGIEWYKRGIKIFGFDEKYF